MKRIAFIIFCIFLFGFFTKARAQFWQSLNGPPGAGASIMAVNPNGDIFVASDVLERSTDDGQTWMRIDLPNFGGLRFSDIRAPRTGLLFGLVQSEYYNFLPQYGVWRSFDNGNNWTQVKQMSIYRINILPNGKIYALYGSSNNGLTDNFSFSTDDGNTWTDTSAQVIGEITNVWSDKIGFMFLATTQYLYRSTDLGDSWSKVVNGLPTSGSGNREIYCAMAQAPNGDLYLAPTDISNIFRSTDYGRTWTIDTLGKNYFRGFGDLKINSNGRMCLLDSYIGAAISDDFGKTLTTTTVPNSIPSLDSTNSEFFFDDNSTIYSSAFGKNDTLTKIFIPNSTVSALVSHPQGSLIAFRIDNSSGIGSIWRSVDGGSNWNNIQGNSSCILASLDSSYNILTAAGGHIVRSTDGGISWIKNTTGLTQGTITGIAVDKYGDIFATSSSEGVFRSTDNGLTWDQLNKGITDQSLYSIGIHQNGDVFVGGKNIIYHSSNQGLTWYLLNTNFPLNAGNVDAMVVSTQGNIIAGIDSIGVWWSTDNGTTWSQRAVGFTGTKVNSLISTPVGKVFAASDSGVFYLDTAAGIGWAQYNSGIIVKNTLSLCHDKSGRIYCGTRENGVYASIQTFNVADPADVRSTGSNSVTSLGTTYPNPITSTAIIPFTIGMPSYITVEIIDPLGRVIKSVISGEYGSGSYCASLDVSKLSSGMYCLRMKAGAQNFMKPIIVGK